MIESKRGRRRATPGPREEDTVEASDDSATIHHAQQAVYRCLNNRQDDEDAPEDRMEPERDGERKYPRAIIEFKNGLNGEPVIFPLGETAEDSEAILDLLARALGVDHE